MYTFIHNMQLCLLHFSGKIDNQGILEHELKMNFLMSCHVMYHG